MKIAASGRCSLGLLGVLTIGVACSSAEAAPIPVTTPGQVLNVPGGQYELAADLVCPAGKGLKIVADGIQFDGKGHTLTGPGATAPGKNVGILVQGVKGVGVRNVTVRGFTFGLRVLDVKTSRIYQVRAISNLGGIQLHETYQSSVIASEFSGGNFGLVLGYFDDNILTNNVVMDNTLTDPAWMSGFSGGFYVGYAERNLIADNAVHRNGTVGIWLYLGALDNTVRWNAITRGKASGIVANGTKNTVVGNTVLGNALYGIAVETGATGQIVHSNRVLSNAAFDLWDNNLPAFVNTWTANTFGTDNEAGAGAGPGVGFIQ